MRITKMKKIILLALTTLTIVGCDNRTYAKIEEAERLKGFNIVVIDSCEYLENSETFGYQGYGYFAHKGNCRYCQKRMRKIMLEVRDSLLWQAE